MGVELSGNHIYSINNTRFESCIAEDLAWPEDIEDSEELDEFTTVQIQDLIDDFVQL